MATGNLNVTDTDALSCIFKKDHVRAWRYEHVEGKRLLVPFAVASELKFDATIKGWEAKRLEELDGFLSRKEIVHPNFRMCETWAKIIAECRRQGRPIEVHDAWIAATALYYRCPLHTQRTALPSDC